MKAAMRNRSLRAIAAVGREDSAEVCSKMARGEVMRAAAGAVGVLERSVAR